MVLALGLLAAGPVSAERWTLDAEQWYRPRDGARIVQLPALSQAVQAWMRAPQRLIVIRYPGGEEGTLWAQELHDWLVALGIPSSALETAPGYPRQGAVEILVEGGEEL